MEYTSMVWTEPFTLIVPKPEEESRLFAFIRPFQPLVTYKFIAINKQSASQPDRFDILSIVAPVFS